ncbi:MAG TPA: hypothetical protein VG474_17545 [Solirubrobacteraceae bacterium]|nr:hypothetical protein [Solirubrobacteraceae bacterium]
MDLLAAWLLYPLALGGLCLGLGLLVERLAGWRLPGLLLLPVGLCTLLALARLLTASAASARLALPALGALALAGLVAGRAQLAARRPDPLIAAAALAVFAIFGGPVVASGSPTFAGYLALPDTSHQLVLAQLLPHHGPDWQALRAGSFQASAATYLASHYPIGAQAALGVSAPLGLLEVSWLYQPFLSFTALVASLALASIAAPLLERRWQVALTVFVAGQPALVLGFALQGSIKEIAALAAIVTAVAVLAAAVAERRPARSLIVLAVAAAAALGVLGPAVLPYLALPGLAVAAVWGVRLVRRRERSDALWLGLGAAAAAIVALPVLGSLGAALNISEVVLVENEDLGNLAAPLRKAQVLGIWLSGDYRYETNDLGTPEDILLVVAALAALLGLAWALRRRAVGPLLLVATLVPASLLLLSRGSPYADGKVLMLLSPVALLLAAIAVAALWRGRWRALGAVLGATLVAGVVSSSALAYHDVSLAPYERYSELLRLNERLAGRGPAIFNEYDEFAKYFLRDVPVLSEPEQASGYRFGPYDPNALLDERRRPSLKTPINMDDLTLAYVQSVPYLILRRSPMASRPPANFRLQSRGRYYEVWRRTASPEVLSHKPLGPDVFTAAEPVSRAVARGWAQRARRLRGRIAVAPRRPPAIAFAAFAPHPPAWVGFGDYPGALVPAGPGRVEAHVAVARSGTYRVWVEGSFARRMTVRVDGEVVGRSRESLNNPGAYESFGTVRLARGRHRVEIAQGGGDLRPGSGGYRSSLRHVGAIVVAPVARERPPVRELEPDRWRELVGVRADWLEVVRRRRARS